MNWDCIGEPRTPLLPFWGTAAQIESQHPLLLTNQEAPHGRKKFVWVTFTFSPFKRACLGPFQVNISQYLLPFTSWFFLEKMRTLRILGFLVSTLSLAKALTSEDSATAEDESRNERGSKRTKTWKIFRIFLVWKFFASFQCCQFSKLSVFQMMSALERLTVEPAILRKYGWIWF